MKQTYTTPDMKEELRELVQVTVKDLTHIGTRISANGEDIEIVISAGSEERAIPISIIDIMANKNSCKGFLNLVKTPLEVLLG